MLLRTLVNLVCQMLPQFLYLEVKLKWRTHTSVMKLLKRRQDSSLKLILKGFMCLEAKLRMEKQQMI